MYMAVILSPARRRVSLGMFIFLATLSARIEATPQDGSSLQRMCQGADKVKALSVMCHSYLNGFLDTAAVYEKGRLPYCLHDGDKERMPSAVVDWLRAHPDSGRESAPSVLRKLLADKFPCTAAHR